MARPLLISEIWRNISSFTVIASISVSAKGNALPAISVRVLVIRQSIVLFIFKFHAGKKMKKRFNYKSFFIRKNNFFSYTTMVKDFNSCVEKIPVLNGCG